MTASSSIDSTVDLGSFGPVRQVRDRAALLPLAHGLLVDAVASGRALSGSLDYAVSLDGSPLSSWRSREEPGP